MRSKVGTPARRNGARSLPGVSSSTGGSVGRGSSDRCEQYHGSAYNQGGYQSGYGQGGYQGGGYYGSNNGYGQGGYSQGGYSQPGYTSYDTARAYDDDRYDDGYGRDDDGSGYSQGYGQSYSSGYGQGDDCRLAESRVRLPDGRYETRYLRSCPDQYGRYRIVD